MDLTISLFVERFFTYGFFIVQVAKLAISADHVRLFTAFIKNIQDRGSYSLDLFGGKIVFRFPVMEISKEVGRMNIRVIDIKQQTAMSNKISNMLNDITNRIKSVGTVHLSSVNEFYEQL
jgi:hypothetical protein